MEYIRPAVLISETRISQRLDALAEEILITEKRDDFVVLLLLNGALFFAADLCRRFPANVEVECLRVASYHGGTQSSGKITFLDASLPDLKGRRVLLVDDILDTGRTLQAVGQALQQHGVEDLKHCVLLSKNKEREQQADYVGFAIEDEFVVGYGLDYAGKYRTLPYIGSLQIPPSS